MGNILIKMAEIKDLTPSERHVVDYILTNYKEVNHMGIVKLAENTFTSTTTVQRLCRKLGIESYTDFRMQLSASLENYTHNSVNHSEQAPVDRYYSVREILEKVSSQNAASILSTSQLVDLQTMEKVVSLMAQVKRIDFYGVGPSYMVAEDAQIKCRRLKIPSSAFCDRIAMLMNAKAFSEDTLAFLISYTGKTDDIIEVAQELRKLKVPTVSLTSPGNNPVANLCRYNLNVDASESWDRLGGMSSRLSFLNLIDALFTALLNTNYETYIANMVDTRVNNRANPRDTRFSHPL